MRVLCVAFVVFSLFFISFCNNSALRVIYGEDTRIENYELDPIRQELTSSVVAIFIGRNSMRENSDGTWRITNTESAESFWDWCPEERFSDQPIPSESFAFCTGFLVSDNPPWIATAAHCVEENLIEFWIVFGWEKTEPSVTRTTFAHNQVYRVNKIVAKGEPTGSRNDWAILELDRTVTGYTPYTRAASVEVGDKISLVGHPFGLSKKIDPDGKVTRVSSSLINGFIDSYGGNSGSPLFNENGSIIGMLVGGAPDFNSRAGGCLISNVCPNGNGCNSLGENILPICVVGANNPTTSSRLNFCSEIEIDTAAQLVMINLVLVGCLLVMVI